MQASGHHQAATLGDQGRDLCERFRCQGRRIDVADQKHVVVLKRERLVQLYGPVTSLANIDRLVVKLYVGEGSERATQDLLLWSEQVRFQVKNSQAAVQGG